MATTRFEARVEADVLSVIRRAAEIQGRTMSDFVISAAREAAQRAISEAEVIRLSVADSERFAMAILSPAKPTEALQRALDSHDHLLRDE
ncbi:type II toxin-antitoxin system TacA family antitoxin [Burkholderia plantarii]|uniref:type II toxin-antitoxin system TacA family antitoxin n=1 Tax=Burkholderia plantarii TaxID=41899 RepID=UPI0018DDA9C2|nr:DUF1778 domain-containing protein [Burkholderia plantarii]MBI0328349.1 DUF1778 domain-containing protein [Burkholderia plantarii]